MTGLPTQSAGAGAFAHFDLARVPSPCFVVDEVALRRNLALLADVQAQSGANILLALKAFSMWSFGSLIDEYLSGTCASGLWEAQLARAHYGGELAVYSPGYKPTEMEEIARLADHVIFNTPAQIARFGSIATAANADIGLRINPQHSEGLVDKYDPCAPGSRLGFPVSALAGQALPSGVSGLHMHTLCEQGFDPLARTIESMRPHLDVWRGQFKWLNLGGGHLVTAPHYEPEKLISLLKSLAQDYDAQLYLELGAAVAFDTAILVGEILDVFDNNEPIAITDISATCHMPDVIEAPYRPALREESSAGGDGPWVRLGGPSCLAGDVIGRYQFAQKPEIGSRIAFLDQGHYSMVKTTTFNGMILPSIAIWNSETDALRMVRTFNYSDFEGRLS